MREISGDIPLSFSEKIQYLVINFFRGLLSFRFMEIVHWTPKQIVDTSQDSLFRIYSNEFIKEELPILFEDKKISILDIGCGSGYIRTKLKDIGFTGRYEGIDIKKHKDFDGYGTDAFLSRINLVPIEEFNSSEKYDLVFSFTALEHVPDDFKAIRNVTRHIAPQGIQIHIVPSFWSLFVYFFHGFRQYTKARLKKLFQGCPYTVYTVGGLGSFLVQIFWFTLPERILKFWPLKRSGASYQSAKYWALKIDKIIPFFPMQYVIVASNKRHDTKVL